MDRDRVLLIVVSGTLALVILGGIAYLHVRTTSERIRQSNEAWYATRTSLAIHGLPTSTPAPGVREYREIYVGMPADDVLEEWGDSGKVRAAGSDEGGAIVWWVYDDATLIMKRWRKNGVTCYRVAEIHPH